MLVRPYHESDFSRVSDIYYQARLFEFAGELAGLYFLPLSQEPETLRMFEQSNVYVFEQAAIIKGFAGYVYNYIAWLYVHPDYHRQKVASTLLSSLLGQINIDPVKLSIIESNTAAKAFYSAFGFEETETFKFEFQNRAMRGMRMARHAAIPAQ